KQAVHGTITNSESAKNLKVIGTAMYTYANENDDRFPPALQTLVENQSITPQMLKSPHDEQHSVSYIYIAGQTATGDLRNILVYEKPGAGGTEGSHALFIDGHVEWVPRERLEKAVAETRQRISA